MSLSSSGQPHVLFAAKLYTHKYERVSKYVAKGALMKEEMYSNLATLVVDDTGKGYSMMFGFGIETLFSLVGLIVVGRRTKSMGWFIVGPLTIRVCGNLCHGIL